MNAYNNNNTLLTRSFTRLSNSSSLTEHFLLRFARNSYIVIVIVIAIVIAIAIAIIIVIVIVIVIVVVIVIVIVLVEGELLLGVLELLEGLGVLLLQVGDLLVHLRHELLAWAGQHATGGKRGMAESPPLMRAQPLPHPSNPDPTAP